MKSISLLQADIFLIPQKLALCIPFQERSRNLISRRLLAVIVFKNPPPKKAVGFSFDLPNQLNIAGNSLVKAARCTVAVPIKANPKSLPSTDSKRASTPPSIAVVVH